MVVNQSINSSHHCKYSGTVAGGGVPGILVDLAARLVEGRGVGKHQLQVSLHLGLTINNIIIIVLWSRSNLDRRRLQKKKMFCSNLQKSVFVKYLKIIFLSVPIFSFNLCKKY